MIGWDAKGASRKGFVAQVRLALREHPRPCSRRPARRRSTSCRLTWYVRDMDEYRASLQELGAVYREVMGGTFPAMAVVEVIRLVEPQGPRRDRGDRGAAGMMRNRTNGAPAPVLTIS